MSWLFSHHLISNHVINYGTGTIWLSSGVNFNFLYKIWWHSYFPSKIFCTRHNSSIYMHYILSCRSRRHGRKLHPWLRYMGYSPCILMMIFRWQWHVHQTPTSTLWSAAFYLTLAVPWDVYMSPTLEVVSPDIDFNHKLYQENGIDLSGIRTSLKKLHSIQFSHSSPNNHHHNNPIKHTVQPVV